jgi:hypothetical protein
MNMLNVITIVRQMGLRYVLFRVFDTVLKHCGVNVLLYPVSAPERKFVGWEEWVYSAPSFFNFNTVNIDRSVEETVRLRDAATRIKKGQIQFFGTKWINLGKQYDWLTNYENGYQYDHRIHWTKVDDYDTNKGDIKNVWEKARFIYLYTIIRNDYACHEDNSSFIWNEILSWIASAPYNCGPHYKCSQEISLRILNWIFALYFYRENSDLTDKKFTKILNSLYVQTKHVERNILFSKIAVRNNHAITESLCLFTVGLLFPWFPESRRWLKKGKRFLEEEGLYQIYNDGGYIQHSFNYQRVVVQLYTWALALAKIHKITFSTQLVERLKLCCTFLQEFIDKENGMVPNWGANDSALFFQLNSMDARDFRPQVNALAKMLDLKIPYSSSVSLLEDCCWYTTHYPEMKRWEDNVESVEVFKEFPTGGYFTIRTPVAATYIRCAPNAHRPFHADNLHIDIWWNHKNIIRDAGTYKYNTKQELLSFFTGTSGHNTVTIDGEDQMQKGERFIWYNWSQAIDYKMDKDNDFITFRGAISAFRQFGKSVIHRRSVKMHRKMPLWVVYDTIEGCTGHRYGQHWNISKGFWDSGFELMSRTTGRKIEPEYKKVWFSDFYGELQEAQQLVYLSNYPEIVTCIYHMTDRMSAVKYIS